MAELNVVDSSGWISALAGEANGDQFRQILLDQERLLVPAICVIEVYRRLAAADQWHAAQVRRHMLKHFVVPLDERVAVAACKIGREHRLHLADSVIYVTARLHDATLWTQDAHFDGLPGVSFLAKPTDPSSPP